MTVSLVCRQTLYTFLACVWIEKRIWHAIENKLEKGKLSDGSVFLELLERMFTQIPWFCFLPFPEDAAPCVWCGLILFLPDCNVTFVQHSWSFIVMMLDHLNYAVQCNYIWGMPFCLRCKQHKADIVYVSLMFVFLKVSSQLISNEWIDEYMNRRDSVKDKFIIP